MVLSPIQWNNYKHSETLDWHYVQFNSTEVNSIPDDEMGIYTFVVCPSIANHPCSYLLYVGKAERQSLRKRVKQYLYEKKNPKGRPPVQDMLIDWESHLWICYATVDESINISDLERALIEAFVPPINQKFDGLLGRAKRAFT